MESPLLRRQRQDQWCQWLLPKDQRCLSLGINRSRVAEGVTTRLKTRQGMGCGVWGVGKIEAMQRRQRGFPP